MSKLERLIEKLNQEVDNEFDNFDPDAEFFDPEMYDADTVRAGSLRALPRVMSKAPSRLHTVPSGIGSSRQAVGNPFPNSTNKVKRYTGDFAQFDIKITRITNTITETLPVAIFGAMADFNDYNRVLNPLLPAGVTLSILREPNKYRFKFQSGSNIDFIEVECQQTPYPSLVKASQFDLLKVAGVRYSISNASNTSQFSNSIIIDERSIFGAKKQNEITPSSFVSPDQFQSGIVDIPQAFETDKETTIITSIGNFSNFSITLSMFVAKWTKYNAKNVL